MPLIPEFVLSLNDYEKIGEMFLYHTKGKEAFTSQDIEAFKYTFSKSKDFLDLH